LKLDVSKPISRHLRMLEEAGIVSRVIVGRNHLSDVVGEYLGQRAERQ
jgi:choline kinase